MQLRDQESLNFDEKSVSTKKPSLRKQFLVWTGFGNKTLWDFLQFLCTAAIPVILTFYGIQQANLAAQREINEEKRDQDNQLHQIMTDYLDSMTAFLLKEQEQLQQNGKASKAQMLAQARTLNTLRQLDPERKGHLLKFLYEAGLVRQCQFDDTLGKVNDCQPSILSLGGARLDEIMFEKPMPLPGVDLTNALLPKAKLPRIDLTGAQLEGANFKDADLTEAYLAEAHMKNAILQDVTATGAKLANANLTGVVLENADFRGANMIKVNLSGAKLANTKLNNANLQEADLRGANLEGVTLEKTIFQGAIYNSTTQFPDGFNPATEGMLQE